MQVKKDKVKEKILWVAKKEFRKQGFLNTSMRTIAEKSEVTTSNIYNYFENKNSLFRELIDPAISKIDQTLLFLEKESGSWQPTLNIDQLKKQIKKLVKFIDAYREELDLIFFKSWGSEVPDIKDRYIERFTKYYDTLFIKLKKDKTTNLSPFFIHNMCSFYANIVTEFIMHNTSYEDMLQYSNEILIFAYSGHSAVLQQDSERLTTIE